LLGVSQIIAVLKQDIAAVHLNHNYQVILECKEYADVVEGAVGVLLKHGDPEECAYYGKW